MRVIDIRLLSIHAVQFVSLFIGFLSVFCVMYVVKSAALLKVRILCEAQYGTFVHLNSLS